MAVTLVDHRTSPDGADSTAGWTGVTTSAGTDPVPVEASGWVGANVGVAILDMYFGLTAADLSDAIVYIWLASRLAVGNTLDANGGYMLLMGDGTDRIGYKVAGADVSGFRHDTGPTNWFNIALDTTSRPAFLVRAGVEANLTFTAITQIGAVVNSLVAAPGMNPNVYVDIIRYFLPSVANGCAMSITGGTSGTPGTFSDIAAADRVITDGRGHGLVRELGVGVFGCQGPLRFGDGVGTAASWFEAKNETVVFEARGFATTRYKIFITDNGTGLATFILGDKVGTGVTATGENGCAIIAASGVGWVFDASTDTDVTDVFIYGTTFRGATGGVSFQTGHEFIGGVIADSGLVTTGGATMVNTKVTGSTVAADASALGWNVATDPNTYLHGMTITKGAAAHHAIEFGTTSPLTMTLTNMNVGTAWGADTTTSATVYIKRTTGTVTIGLVGCTGTFTYKSDGATVVISASVPLSVEVLDTNGAPLQSVRVSVRRVSDGTSILDGTTNASGLVTGSVAYTADISVKVIARYSSGSPRFGPLTSPQTVTNIGMVAVVTLVEDDIAS